jgi:hypothetical protein
MVVSFKMVSARPAGAGSLADPAQGLVEAIEEAVGPYFAEEILGGARREGARGS